MADTLVNSLFPPEMDTYQNPFIHINPAPIVFSLSQYNTASQIKHIQISLVDQQSNLSAFKENYCEGDLQTAGGAIVNHILILPFNYSEYGTQAATADAAFIVHNQDDDLFQVNISTNYLKDDKSSYYSPTIYTSKGEAENSHITSNQTSFKINQFYKVQIRFDNVSDNGYMGANGDTPTPTWLTSKRPYFSEWSDVTLLKAIPQVAIQLDRFNSPLYDSAPRFHKGMANITGYLSWGGRIDESTQEEEKTEYLQSYKFQIYNANWDTMISETDWIYAIPNINTIDNHDLDVETTYGINYLLDVSNLKSGVDYHLRVQARTNNGYLIQDTIPSDNRTFRLYVYQDDEFKNVKLMPTLQNEDGFVNIRVVLDNEIHKGTLYIRRSSSVDNFKTWELISATKQQLNIDYTIRDYTVASLYRYKYVVQYKYDEGSWTNQYDHYNPNSDAAIANAKRNYNYEYHNYIYPTFYDILLYRQGKQLAVRYNGKIDSLAPQVNRQKIDTLGGKYPKFAENALMNYKQFNISGIISGESDYNRRFMDETDAQYIRDMATYDETFDGAYSLRNDTVADGEYAYSSKNGGNDSKHYLMLENYPISQGGQVAYIAELDHQHDIYPMDNWYWERIFRDKALEWLNDGNPKLFRSKPEGNMCVMLTNVSLSPEDTIGRRLYSFTATAYEVGDGYNLDTLDSLGIIDRPTLTKARKSFDAGGEEKIDDTIVTVQDTKLMQIYNNQYYNLNDLRSGPWGTGTQKGLLNNQLNSWKQSKFGGSLAQKQPDMATIVLYDVKVQFTSEPRWYTKNDDGSVSLVTDEQLNDTSALPDGAEYWFGYVLYLKTVNAKDSGFVPILINHRGYYVVPDNLQIADLYTLDGDEMIVDCIMTYNRTLGQHNIASNVEVVNDIVGQYSKSFDPDVWIGDDIKKKYHYERWNDTGEFISMEEEMQDWYGICLDVEPYTEISIINESDTNSQEQKLVVGRTGVLNIDPNVSISNLKFNGRRMFENNDITDVSQLDDWEYKLDFSAITDFSDNLYWKDFQDDLTNSKVVINDQTDIYPMWLNYLKQKDLVSDRLTNTGYSSVRDIENPQRNTVYGFAGSNGTQYYIYYENDNWYEVEPLDDKNSIILAKLPVFGMVNYKGKIWRSEYK